LAARGASAFLADDPIAPGEIAALCAEHGWTCQGSDGAFEITIGAPV
jgi:hypothetical protein